MIRRWYGKVFLLIILYLTFCTAMGIVVAEFAVHPNRRALTSNDEIMEKVRVEGEKSALLDVSIAGRDGAPLRAWYLQPIQSSGDAVILLHGHGDNRLGMRSYADMFLLRGYSVLIPDSRAHGVSGGAIATYGLLESDDIQRWFDWLKLSRSSKCIYGLGESMGAAQILHSLSTEPHFCAVAVECPFATFREIAYDRMGQRFGAGPWVGRTMLRPLVEVAFLYVHKKYGVDLRQVSPESSVANTKVPILLIHGLIDNNIPIRHSKRIASANPRLVLWEVPNTGHTAAVTTSPKEFETRLTDWFASQSQLMRGYINHSASTSTMTCVRGIFCCVA